MDVFELEGVVTVVDVSCDIAVMAVVALLRVDFVSDVVSVLVSNDVSVLVSNDVSVLIRLRIVGCIVVISTSAVVAVIIMLGTVSVVLVLNVVKLDVIAVSEMLVEFNVVFEVSTLLNTGDSTDVILSIEGVVVA